MIKELLNEMNLNYKQLNFCLTHFFKEQHLDCELILKWTLKKLLGLLCKPPVKITQVENRKKEFGCDFTRE